MSEKQGDAKMSAVPPADRTIIDFAREFLADDAVAIVIKQHLLPDDVENPVIFPPTYLKAKGRAQDGEKDDKKENKESKQDQQKSVYNVDDLGDGKNVCEIDSPQSDGNRSEPLFKSPALRHLVPQIEIAVGDTSCNLLDAGHRAGDALVRFSSLAADLHVAFLRADLGDQSVLASLAPTSLLYGAWDSRSTQTKLQRIVKAGIQASNVRPLTKSATFIPAVDYVAVGAIKEELDVGEGDSNPLSSEGMKHALASQTLGGVRLTDPKLLARTVKINLVALRQLRAIVDPPRPEEKPTDERNELEGLKTTALKQSNDRTTALRNYILGLALTAATADPHLNLREGCNLRITGDDSWLLVRHRKDDEPITVRRDQILAFAKDSAAAFFKEMGIDFERKDRLDAKFESAVGEEFLALPAVDRDKVRALGPITGDTLRKFAEQGKNPFKLVADAVKGTKVAIGKSPTKNAPRVKNLEAFKPLAEALKAMSDNASIDGDARDLALELTAKALEHDDSHAALKEIESKIKEFKKVKKAGDSSAEPAVESEAVQ